MFPTLFTIGNLPVSSFGVFLALGLLSGIFLIWRLSRAWDLNEERVLDLTLLTFLGGVIGARVYFGLENWEFFAASPLKILLFTKYPGFSFWGGFLGGWLSLYYFSRSKKWDFWLIADIASIGFLGGLIFANLGCLLGGCNVGIVSKMFWVVPMVGQVGKRVPVQAFEALFLTIVLLILWSKATHFHLRGRIVSLALIYIGLIKLLLEPFKQVHEGDYIFSAIIILLGLTIFYKLGKRNIVTDLKSAINFSVRMITDRNTQKVILEQWKKNWYNRKVYLGWKLRSVKKALRRLNVRFSP